MTLSRTGVLAQMVQSDELIHSVVTDIASKLTQPAPFSRLFAITPPKIDDELKDEIKIICIATVTKEKHPEHSILSKISYSSSVIGTGAAFIGGGANSTNPLNWSIDYKPRVLPNSYYFSYSYSHDLSKFVSSIVNVCNSYDYRLITDALEPSTAIILCNDNDSLQYGCVSADKQEIYQYSLKYIHTTFRQWKERHYDSHRNEPRNPKEWDKIASSELKFEHELDPSWKFSFWHKGDCVYKLDKENASICSIASFPESKEKCMAVALDTGEIKLGHIKEKKFVETAQLVKPSEIKSEQPSKEEIELLSSKNGFLIVHHVNKKMLNIWDINQQKLLFEAKDLQVNKLNITIDGQYLTALEGEEGIATKTVFIYNFASSERHVLKLDEPVTDFLINSDNSICMMTEKGLKRVEGTAEKYLETYYQKLIEKDPDQAKALVRSHPKLSIFAPKADRGDSKSQDKSPCLVM